MKSLTTSEHAALIAYVVMFQCLVFRSIDISQGSVATSLSYARGIINTIRNLLLSLAVR